MKKMSFLKNPFFYLSVVLLGVFLFQVAQVVEGQVSTWQPPTAPPPGGQPAPPLDTSSFPQMKGDGVTGDLTVVGKFNVLGGVWVGPERNDSVRIQRDSRRIDFIDLGNMASILFEPTAGANGNGRLMATHNALAGEWFELGSGTGTGGGVWVPKIRGIAYAGGTSKGVVGITAGSSYSEQRLRIPPSSGGIALMPFYHKTFG